MNSLAGYGSDNSEESSEEHAPVMLHKFKAEGYEPLCGLGLRGKFRLFNASAVWCYSKLLHSLLFADNVPHTNFGLEKWQKAAP